MKRMTVILAGLWLTACAMPSQSVLEFDQRATRLSRGMTQPQVEAIMGAAKNKQFSGAQEALQWCETSMSSGTLDSYLVAIFVDGKLVQTNTYRNNQRGYCESFFKPVEWVRPDRIIELRNR